MSENGQTALSATVVVAACNEGQNLLRTIESCRETSEGLSIEFVVVDDGSTDGSTGVLASAPDVVLVTHEVRHGVSAAKDRGAREATESVLVFLDAHCKPEKGALLRLVQGVQRLGSDVIVTPAVANLDTSTWRNHRGRLGHGYALDLETFDSHWLGLEQLRRVNEHYESPCLIGCCLAIARDTYTRLGGFDAGMQQWGLEDVDFGLRAWLQGISILHDPRAIVGHRFQSEFSGYEVADEHVLANQLRLAFRCFGDEVWEDWRQRAQLRHSSQSWEQGWGIFRESQASAEASRVELRRTAHRDEWWYADRFALKFPFSPKRLLKEAVDLPRNPGEAVQYLAERLVQPVTEGDRTDGLPAFRLRLRRDSSGKTFVDRITCVASEPLDRVYAEVLCFLAGNEPLESVRRIDVPRLLSFVTGLPKDVEVATRVIKGLHAAVAELGI